MEKEIKMTETDSVLNATKVTLGLNIEDDSFDRDLLSYINGAIGVVDQAGGLKEPTMITDASTTWDSICLPNATVKVFVQMYVITYTRIHFDPPAPSTQKIMESSMTETIWRLEIAVDAYRKEVESEYGIL